jgi:transposase InsO family protein
MRRSIDRPRRRQGPLCERSPLTAIRRQAPVPALSRGAAYGQEAQHPQARTRHPYTNTIPQGPNQRWSLDFAAEVLSDGRRFRVLVVVDDFNRERLALVVDYRTGSSRA